MINSAMKQQYGESGTTDIRVDCVIGFMEAVWNENRYSEMGLYLHDAFVDYSMPFMSFQDQKGLSLYLEQLGRMVRHRTEILDMAVVDDVVICQINISAVHLDEVWRLKEPPEIINGYRFFKMHDNKIIAHWEIL